MSKRLIITRDKLSDMDACKDGIFSFEEVFPKGATITLANVKKALNNNLNVNWLLGRLLLDKQYVAYENERDGVDTKLNATIAKFQKQYDATGAAIIKLEDKQAELEDILEEMKYSCDNADEKDPTPALVFKYLSRTMQQRKK